MRLVGLRRGAPLPISVNPEFLLRGLWSDDITVNHLPAQHEGAFDVFAQRIPRKPDGPEMLA